MKSPLEDKPKILEKTGLFINLFNLIDSSLGIEFVYIIDQSDTKKRPVLDFLRSQDFSKKLDMLKLVLGEDLYLKIYKINKFRNFITHGMYGMNDLGEISIAKIKGKSGKYNNIPLSEDILNKNIKHEREVLNSFHELILKRMGK